ncbi:MAG: hypothetical protein H6728_12675 [Myxococcales bacterium]|nr:hypothetical protein [Myxococcales bacterium]MCB9643922.1 hypothetical protein [Myxococcales bacterium]
MLKKLFGKNAKTTDEQAQSSKASEPTLAALLHGLKPGRMQSVGVMQVIPLLGEIDDDRFAAPDKARVWTEGYGNLNFENKGEQTVLVPCHTGYIVEEAAQDHAMAHAAVIPPKKKEGFKTAMCIQQTQGGYISSGEHKMMILPYALRESAHEKRQVETFNKLWSDISAWNKRFGLSEMGNLVLFTKHFQKQLDEFVAEFECLPKQQGAIILIGGEVVGIERAPSSDFFKSVWSALIRECYGSEAIAYSQSMDKDAIIPGTRVPLRQEGIRSLDDLAQALEEAEAKEEEIARAEVRRLLDLPIQTTQESTTQGLDIETLQSETFLGQLIRDKERVCYASLFLSKQARRRQAWKDAPSFSI